MDIYNLANIIIPCITLGVSFFTPGVSSECDRMFRIVLIITAVIELLGALFQNEFLVFNNIVYNIYTLLLFLSYCASHSLRSMRDMAIDINDRRAEELRMLLYRESAHRTPTPTMTTDGGWLRLSVNTPELPSWK